MRKEKEEAIFFLGFSITHEARKIFLLQIHINRYLFLFKAVLYFGSITESYRKLATNHGIYFFSIKVQLIYYGKDIFIKQNNSISKWEYSNETQLFPFKNKLDRLVKYANNISYCEEPRKSFIPDRKI